MKWIQGYLNDDNQGKWSFSLIIISRSMEGKPVFLSNLKQQDFHGLI